MGERFPFIGAGDASYFEWAEVLVRFTRAPNERERRAIAKDVPPPLGDLKWEGAALSASSEQGVGRQIKAAYGKTRTAPKALVMQNRFALASGTAYARFNAHTEAWLEAAHAVVPILVAYRREDHEAGGTKLSAWHTESLSALPRVLATIAAGAKVEDASLATRLVGAAAAAKVALPAKTKATIAKLEKKAEAEEDARREAENEAEEAELARGVAALDAGAKKTKKVALAGAKLEAALDSLAKALPDFAKRLRKLESKALRAGAAKTAIDAVEKALGQKLVPEHRALLTAFDGGRIGRVFLAGTSAGGGQGRDDVVALTRVYASHDGVPWAVTVASAGDVLLQARLRGSKPDMFLQQGHGGRMLKSSKKLDTLLVELLKQA